MFGFCAKNKFFFFFEAIMPGKPHLSENREFVRAQSVVYK